MSALRAIISGLRTLFWKRHVDRELDEELGDFLAMAVEEKVKQGMSRADALRAVRLERGSAEVAKEVVRDSGWESVLETCWQDLRLALRMLRKSPGFTAVVVVMLAFGIGANTAIFSLMNALMFHSVAVRNSATLVELLHRYPGEPAFNGFSWDAYQVLRQNHVLSDLLIAPSGTFLVRVHALEPRTVFGGYVSGTFFETLGLQPAAGRLIGPEADDPSHPFPVAVVSWMFWKDNFNLDPAIVGEQIVVNDTPVTIIGVAQQGFSGLNEEASQEVWLPLSMRLVNDHSALGWFSLALIGRLKPGVDLEQARAELAVLFQSAVQAPGVGPYVRKMRFELQPAANGLSNPIRQMLRTPVLVLMAITSLVLLIACANLAGLLLARGAARRHEMALRVCLGAGRLPLLCQVFTESLLLSLCGGLLGVFLAHFGGRWVLRMITSGRDVVGLPVRAEVLARPDAHVLWYTSAVTVVTALLFGLLPAVGLSAQPALALQQVARIGESRSRRLLGKGLIVVQVAASTVLLSVAVLLVGYVSHLRNADLGFRRDHLLLLQLDPSHSGYNAARLSQLSQELLAQLETLPGVRSATFSATTPMHGAGASSFATAKGHPEVHREVVINHIAPHYFDTYGTPLVAGRDFGLSDEDGPLVAIINEALARDFFGSDNPVGSYMTLDHVTLRGNDTPTYHIVGVVGDAKYNYLQQPAPRTIYLHAFQEGRVVSQLTVRTAVNPASLTGVVRERVASILRTVPITRTTTMTDQIDRAIVPERLTATLSSWFGALGALLAAVGLYGLLAYNVSRRTNEIGVRMALGATTGNVMRVVLAEAFGMVGMGLALGVPFCVWAKQIATKLIPDLTVNGPVWILCGAVGILAVTLLAAFLPARRASAVDPMVALRYE